MNPTITLNRNVLSSALFLLEAGQAARAKNYERVGHERMSTDLRSSAQALSTLAQRIEAGTIADLSISGALERILTA